jgi:hypothetical protein
MTDIPEERSESRGEFVLPQQAQADAYKLCLFSTPTIEGIVINRQLPPLLRGQGLTCESFPFFPTLETF